jgi:predicted enzyme related to lactoylglutathione lyase
MPKLESVPFGAPCWVDIMTSDQNGARAFYGELFGWTSDEPGEAFGGYVNFHKDGVPVAGCMAGDGSGGVTNVWSVYLAVENAKASVDAAAEHGGQVLVPAMEVGDLGSMAVVTDAGQAAIGMWQPGLHKGFGLFAELGSPAWFELMTRDYDASVTFYEDVFGWDTDAMSDSPEFRYTTLGRGDSAAAGIMDASGFLPEGVPAHWTVYFLVADTDAALAKVVELGGSVVEPAQDSPHGRMARVADPTRTHFKVISPVAT